MAQTQLDRVYVQAIDGAGDGINSLSIGTKSLTTRVNIGGLGTDSNSIQINGAGTTITGPVVMGIVTAANTTITNASITNLGVTANASMTNVSIHTLSVVGQTTLANVGVAGQTTLQNTSVNGTLRVDGQTTLINVSATSLTASSLTILNNVSVGGNVSIGSLFVSSNLVLPSGSNTVLDNASINGTLRADGVTTLKEVTLQNASINLNTRMDGSLTVKGATEFYNTVASKGASNTFTVEGQTTLSNTSIQGLTVSGNTSLSNTVITGTTDINRTGSATTTIGNSGSMTVVAGNASLRNVSAQDLTVTGTVNVSTNITGILQNTYNLGIGRGIITNNVIDNFAGGDLSLRNKPLNSLHVADVSNTIIRIGPMGYQGTAANTTEYGLERSRHSIVFSGFRDQRQDLIGTKISSINKQTYGGGTQQLIQSSDLAFFTMAPGLVPTTTDITTERMRIMDGGNVGIGTSAPGYTLDVSGTLGVRGLTTLSGGATVTGTTTALNSTTTTVGGTFTSTGATTLSSTLGVTGATTLSGGATVTGTTTALNSTATTVGGTFTSTGATTLSSTLGVTGATTLSSTLGVTGATTLSGGVTVTGNTSINTTGSGNTTIGNSNGYTYLSGRHVTVGSEPIGGLLNGAMQVIGESNAVLMVIPKSNVDNTVSHRGNIALYASFIGVGVPGSGDHVPRRAADIYAGYTYAWTSEYLGFAVGGGDASGRSDGTQTTERMRIQANGNVGIGKTNPTSTLDVSGTMNVTGTSGNQLLNIQNTPANTTTDPPGSYTGTNLTAGFVSGYQSTGITTITGGFRFSTALNVQYGKIAINTPVDRGQMYKFVFTVRSTTSDTNVWFEAGNGNTVFELGIVGNVMKTYTVYATSPRTEYLYIGVSGSADMQRTIEYEFFSIEPVYNITASRLTATSLGTNSLVATNLNATTLNASNMLIGETVPYAPFAKFPLQVVGNHENGLAIFPKINGFKQFSNIAMYASFATNFNNDDYPKRCADIYAGRYSNWGGEYIAFGVGTNAVNYDHNKTITRMSINGEANTTVTIGQYNYKGTGDNNTLNAETSRHTIMFTAYWGGGNFNGASIAAVNKQSFNEPGNRGGLQSSELAFHTTAPVTGNSNERMRIMDTGNVGIGITIPTALLDVNGSLVYSTAATRSDRRIKTDILDVEDQQALIDLRRLKPKTYGYKDSRERGNERVYGFIAQEVKEVLNYAGDLTKDYIPNIYEHADFVNDILTFTTFNTSSLERDASGDIFTKLKVKTKDLKNEYLTIVEVLDEHTLKVDTNSWSKDASGQLICPDNPFVFGQEVDNFNTLNKDAIWTVATAALQEVDRQLQSEKQKVSTLETTLASTQATLASCQETLAALVARIDALEQR